MLSVDVEPSHEGGDMVYLVLDAVDSGVMQLEDFQVAFVIVIRR